MCRAFGEYGDGLVPRHGIPKVIDLTPHTQFVFAADEYRIVDFAKPADQWPAFDPVIGDESAAGDAGHHRNIDPAMVICRVKDVSADPHPFGGGGNAAGPADR